MLGAVLCWDRQNKVYLFYSKSGLSYGEMGLFRGKMGFIPW